jgi:polyhydroxyalkanoate synthesis regulator phasin
MVNTARDRAEELLHNLQKRAKEMLEAEDGVVKTVRDLIEDKGLAPADVKKRLEEVVGKLNANSMWDKIRTSDAVVALSDYRDELENRVEDSVQRLLGGLQIVTKSDLKDLESDLAALRKKVDSLKKSAVKTDK